MSDRSQTTAVLATAESELLETERRRRGQLAALLTVTHTVSHTLDLGQILRTIVEQMRMVIPCEECTVYLFDADDQTLRPSAMNYDSYVDAMEAVRFSLGEGLTGWVAKHREGAIVADARRDPRVVHIPGTPNDESAMLSVPLISRDELLGVITVEGRTAGMFDDEHLELATLFAGPCGSAIANARLYEEARLALDAAHRTRAEAIHAARFEVLAETEANVEPCAKAYAGILAQARLLLERGDAGPAAEPLRLIERMAQGGKDALDAAMHPDCLRPSPAPAPRMIPSSPSASAPTPGSAPPRVRALVADDEESVLDVLCDLLESMDVEVTRALGGKAALAAIEEGSFDAVFTDLGMPDVSGWDVAAAARRRRADTRVALVTGWGSQIDAREAQARGVDVVLAKPFALEEVERVIDPSAGGEAKAA